MWFLFRECLIGLIPNATFHDGILINSTLQIENLDSLLKNIYGFENFRKNQRESIESYLSEKNTLTIMKTGGGKTLIYSAAALLSNRLTVVFSPLKSLMDDQLHSLINIGIAVVVLFVSSDQPPAIQEKIFGEIASGLIRILFVTVEKYIKNPKFRNMLKNVDKIQGVQFVIDEVYCVLDYGHY
ncbi:3420_t:CDS:2, partial [Funneliformis geosporum]